MVCKHCGKPIFMLTQAFPPRYVHGKNENDWEWTRCDPRGPNYLRAEPQTKQETLALIKKYR